MAQHQESEAMSDRRECVWIARANEQDEIFTSVMRSLNFRLQQQANADEDDWQHLLERGPAREDS